jgi:hypothetical protein
LHALFLASQVVPDSVINDKGDSLMKLIALCCALALLCPLSVLAERLPVSGKSSVVIVLKHTPPGKDGNPPRSMTLSVEDSGIQNRPAPNGSVFDIAARHDASIRFRIENFNTLKYSVKENAVAVEEAKLTLPPIFTKAFDGLIAKVDESKRSYQLAGAPLDEFDRTLRDFDTKAKDLNNFMEAVKRLKQAIKVEESHRAFLSALDKIGTDLSLVNEWYKADNLSDIIRRRKSSIDQMADILVALRRLAEQPPIELSKAYAVKEAADVTGEALDFKKDLDEIQKTITAYVEDGNAKVFTYMSPKPIDFKGGKLSIKQEVFLKGDDKQEDPRYRLDFEVSSESKTFFDTSAGVFFCSVRDETFNLRDINSGQINSSASPNNVIVRNGSQNSLGANFGAMIHYGAMFKRNLAAAFSLGLATGDNRYNFYLGGSAAFDERRRFYLSGGFALASVRRLKGYNEGDRFAGAASDIPTDYRYKPGYFFGVSYKF